MAKNAEYDSAWCSNHEKLYLSKSKNQFLRSKFFGQKLRLKKLLWIGKSNWPKMQNMTQRVALIRENYIWAHKKKNLNIEIFRSEVKVKKFLWNWEIELAKNVEYDSAWCANQEKLYLSPSKNQFLRSKFFRQKLR